YHFAGRGVQEALARYRSGFRPARAGDEPRTIAVVNTVVAPDAATARRLAEPQLRTMLRLRTGQSLTAQPSVEEAEAETLTVEHAGLLEAMAESWVIDAPGPAAARLTDLASSMRTDEVMVVPVAGALRGTPAAEAPGRIATLEMLAEQLL
ncbi:MAG: LLM class flavin-dependent oxidoreductase, partial [Cellulomonadaceae bacterium]